MISPRRVRSEWSLFRIRGKSAKKQRSIYLFWFMTGQKQGRFSTTDPLLLLATFFWEGEGLCHVCVITPSSGSSEFCHTEITQKRHVFYFQQIRSWHIQEWTAYKNKDACIVYTLTPIHSSQNAAGSYSCLKKFHLRNVEVSVTILYNSWILSVETWIACFN
jgi:hypothetical protein